MADKQYSKIDLFIRSLLFSIFSITTIVIVGTLCILALPLSLKFRHTMVRNYMRFYMKVLKFLCRIDYTVEGLENIQGMKSGVVLSKHQSTWETFYLPQVFHMPVVIVKRELLWVPFFGWGLATAAPIAIDRSNRSSAMQQVISKGRKCLEEGRWVILFPEGTRVAAGTVGHYRLGGARLAIATGYPVVPVAHNAGRCWPRRKFLKIPGKIHVVIGKPIESTGRTPEDLTAEVKDWIESTIQRIESA